jgi:hypothetical protein
MQDSTGGNFIVAVAANSVTQAALTARERLRARLADS